MAQSMGLTVREKCLRQIAHERCEAGELVNRAPVKTWAGEGSGQRCSLCGEPIASSQVEYEVDVPDGEVLRTFRFHLLCHQVWSVVATD